MPTLLYKSASPFMPQGSEKVTKITVVFDGDGVDVDDVLPFIGNSKGHKGLTDQLGDQPASNDPQRDKFLYDCGLAWDLSISSMHRQSEKIKSLLEVNDEDDSVVG